MKKADKWPFGYKRSLKLGLILAATSLLVFFTEGAQAISTDEKIIRYRNMDLCESKLDDLKGFSAGICKNLLNSEDFRKLCSEIPDENLIRCDGSEPSGTIPMNLSDLKRCIPEMVIGAKDTVVEVAELGWEAIKATGRAAVWLLPDFGSESSESDTSPSVSVDSAMSSIGQQMRLSDDPGAYAAHTALDEQEAPSMASLMLTSDFWMILGEELAIWLEQEIKQIDCLSSKAKTELMCYIVGGFAPGGLLKIGKLIKIAAKTKDFAQVRAALRAAGSERLKAARERLIKKDTP